jgi:hypothetical protein
MTCRCGAEAVLLVVFRVDNSRLENKSSDELYDYASRWGMVPNALSPTVKVCHECGKAWLLRDEKVA